MMLAPVKNEGALVDTEQRGSLLCVFKAHGNDKAGRCFVVSDLHKGKLVAGRGKKSHEGRVSGISAIAVFGVDIPAHFQNTFFHSKGYDIAKTAGFWVFHVIADTLFHYFQLGWGQRGWFVKGLLKIGLRANNIQITTSAASKGGAEADYNKIFHNRVSQNGKNPAPQPRKESSPDFGLLTKITNQAIFLDEASEPQKLADTAPERWRFFCAQIPAHSHPYGREGIGHTTPLGGKPIAFLAKVLNLPLTSGLSEALCERRFNAVLEGNLMTALVSHTFNHSHIQQRSDDGYFSATAMCKAAGKLWANYYQNDSTKAYLTALSGSIGIPIDRLVTKIMKGPNAERGTWVHPKVAIHLAQWLSPEFAVWCTNVIYDWMQGKTVVVKEHRRKRTVPALPAARPTPEQFAANIPQQDLLITAQGHLNEAAQRNRDDHGLQLANACLKRFQDHMDKPVSLNLVYKMMNKGL